MIAAKAYAGALISYRFLWPSDHDMGFDCAETTQPCVVMAVQDLPDWKFKVLVCPITHTPRADARVLDVAASTAIRWVERWTRTGSVEAKPGDWI